MMSQTVIAAVLLALLVAASLVDLRTRRLPDVLTLSLIVLGLAQQLARPDLLAVHAASALAGFLALWTVARHYRARAGTDGIGLGDAKLFAAAGAWLGPLALAPLLLMASLLALIVAGIARLAGHAISFRSRMPFGPFLSLAFFSLWLMEAINFVPG